MSYNSVGNWRKGRQLSQQSKLNPDQNLIRCDAMRFTGLLALPDRSYPEANCYMRLKATSQP